MPRFTKFYERTTQKKGFGSRHNMGNSEYIDSLSFLFCFLLFPCGRPLSGSYLRCYLILIWVITYPFVGKLISLVIGILCNAIDKIYSLENSFRFGRWSGNTSLLVASLWPIVFPMIFVCVIAIVYGALFQHLYGIGEK